MRFGALEPERGYSRVVSSRVRAVVWALGWALFAWGLLGSLTPELEANADTERDVLRALLLIDHGILPATGPAIDYLPVALPPTWYFLVAPMTLVWRSLEAIHTFHVLVLMVGLVAIAAWRGPERPPTSNPPTGAPPTGAQTGHSGPRGALTIGVLLGTAYVPEVLASVWHNGLVPGISALWVAALLRTDSSPPIRAAWALAAAFSCSALLVQLHVVSALTFLAPALILAVRLRRDGAAIAWPAHLVTLLVLGALAATTLSLLWGLDLERASAIMEARTSSEASWLSSLGAATLRLSELLTPNIMKDIAPVGAVWLALAAVGAFSARAGASRALRLALSVSVFTGLAGAAMLSRLDPAPRYFGPSLWAVVGLAALGARAIAARFTPREHALKANTRAGVWLALAALALWPLGRPAAGEALRETAIPSLREQATLAAILRDDYGAGLNDLDRLHGPVMNGLSAMRLQAVLALWPVAGEDRGEADAFLYAGPADFPAPASLTDERQVTGGSDRDWLIGRMVASSRLLSAHVAGRRCTIGWPQRWSALEADELRPFGLRAGASVESCRSRRPGAEAAPLVLELEVLATRSTLVLGWFDVVRHRPEHARVTLAPGPGTLTRLDGPLWRDLAGWTLEVQTAPARVRLAITPVETLSTVELY